MLKNLSSLVNVMSQVRDTFLAYIERLEQNHDLLGKVKQLSKRNATLVHQDKLRYRCSTPSEHFFITV